MKRTILVLFAALFFAFNLNAQTTFIFADLVKLKRVGDPQVSPDGKTVAFTIGEVNLAANRTLTHIYTIPVAGGTPKQITKGDKSFSSPRWSPDGKKIAYVTGGQIGVMDSDGSDKKQITKISTGASGPVWSGDGKMIAFSSEVYPECKTDECNKTEDERLENSKMQAKVTDRLLFRHWVEWRDRKRTHVFVIGSNGGNAQDMTPGDFDSPPYAAATGIDYTFSPGAKELLYLRNPDKVEAISTNSDIYSKLLNSGDTQNITQNNKGYDVGPAFTSDGKYLIYRSQATEGFEADRWRIMRYNRQTSETVELTKGFDLQAEELVISPDNKTIYFTAGERGRQPIFTVPVEPDFRLRIATHVKPLITGVFASNLNITQDGKTLVYLASSMVEPAEIRRSNADGSPQLGSQSVNLTEINASARGRALSLDLKQPEEMEWRGAINKTVHGFLLKPANFDPNKKYPLLVLIHGGPQSAWNNNWGYRWNPQMFANAGYVVFMPNPRGSTGYGQKFVNEISADWGGKVYTDIMNGVAAVLAKNPYIDKQRIGAAGASYGGYMINWIEGHNNDPRFKFKVLHTHSGVYNLESMATATEELWFVNWEFKGMPWQNPTQYNTWSPHKFVKNFNTPMLITHGELDYRVPIGEGLQLYTTLQHKGIESKFVYFPDEGHWILKPQNSEFWYGQVLGWFGKHLNP